MQGEGAAPTGVGVDGDLASVKARQLPAKVQAQTGTGQVISLRRRYPAESREQDRQVLPGDAHPMILDADPRDAPPVDDVDLDRAALRRILDRVADEVGDDRLDTLTVNPDMDRSLGALDPNLVLAVEHRPRRIDRGLDD